MRYRDAAHVDVGGFYARRPELGKGYRLLGYVAILFAAIHYDDAETLARLLIALVLVWLAAWYRIVGTLWRSSVVAAALLCAVLLSGHRLHWQCPFCPVTADGWRPTADGTSSSSLAESDRQASAAAHLARSAAASAVSRQPSAASQSQAAPAGSPP